MGDYDYVVDVQVERDASGTAMLAPAVAVSVNAANLVSGGYLQADGEDLLAADQSNVAIAATAQDLVGAPATWWLDASDLAAGQTTLYHLYMGDPTATSNQGFVLAGQDRIEVADVDELDATSSLIVEVTAESSSCGTLVAKTLSSNNGWGLWWEGDTDETTVASTSSTGQDHQYWRITPANDITVCGIREWLGTPTRVRIYDDDAATVVLDSAELTRARDNYYLANQSVRLSAGQRYTVLLEFSSSFNASQTWIETTSAGHTFDASATTVSIAGDTWHPHRVTAGNPVGVMYRDVNSGLTDVVGAVANSGRVTVSSGWDGAEATWHLCFTSSTLELDDDDAGGSCDSPLDTQAAGFSEIAANSQPVYIGGGLAGWVDRTIIVNTLVSRSTLFYEPDEIAQTQEGSDGNGWTWTGTIADLSPCGCGTGTYTLIRDQSNYTVTVGGLQISPSAPQALPDLPLANVAGVDASTTDFFSPPPETGGPIMGNLDAAAVASSMQDEAWWWLLLTLVAAVLSSWMYRHMPSMNVAAGVAGAVYVIGIAAGQLSPWWLVLTGFGAAGFLAIHQLGTR